MRHLLSWPFLLVLCVCLGAPPAGGADGDDPPAPAPGEEKPAPEEPLDDKADDKVTFVDEVNKAIDLGTKFLLLRPYQEKQQRMRKTAGSEDDKGGKRELKPFKVPLVGVIPGYEDEKQKVEGAHWGFIEGQENYGGGNQEAYHHPAGPTALALYTLLKCGEDDDHPMIRKGFQWLRLIHRIDEDWDSNQFGEERWWTHTAAVSSYELSVMVLALTAKYDTHKRTKNTQAKRRQGKLRITDKEERLWLEQMVELLVRRRGEPFKKPTALSRSDFERLGDYRKELNLPPEPDAEGVPAEGERLGWRYNVPHLDLIQVFKRDKKTSTQSQQRSVGIPPHANQDLSSTQLATLALFNAHLFGVKPTGWPKVWGDIVQFTLDHQEKEGPEHERFVPGYTSDRYGTTKKKDHARGFMYIPGSTDRTEGTATGAMTACGVSMLVMARTILLEDKDGKEEWDKRGFGKTDEKTRQNVVDTAIWDGLAWLDLNWSSFENPRGGNYHVYYLYALERAMDLLGKNLLGKHPWYTEGARRILDNLKKRTVRNPFEKDREVDVVYWDLDASHEPQDVLDTCFALLFLKRAMKDTIPPPAVTGGDDAPVDNR